MPKMLTPAQIAQYEYDGYVHPVRVLSSVAAATIRAKLETFEAATGEPLKGDLRHKTHLLFTWLADLVRTTGIVDAIEDLYGPDLLCWSSSFFIKEARSLDYVSWHQDSTYWGLNKPNVVSAWVALTPSNVTNGAMEVIPGSHRMDQVPHRDTFAKHNLLTRGQEVMVDVDARQAVRIELEPGEMSLHHVRLIHGSPANPSDARRIGFAIRYIPTDVHQIAGEDSATLVRGIDRYRTFADEPPPCADMDPAAVALHRGITERNAQILYRGTTVGSYNDPLALADRSERPVS
ncbi:MAG: phytanoyl-CoA dioxygenase family protein [Gammaproteobacteria bacterium]|nr:phytanoyl-CoA dioxygenase family protein [Gammaproteobacteria bacterium]